MNTDPILALSGHFDFSGKKSFYFVEFQSNLILIKDDKICRDIKYTDVAKIKYSSTSLKIIMKSGEKIKMPCSSTDVKKIKTYFKTSENIENSIINASAVVSVGEYHFFITLESTSIKEMKIKILQRVAKLFYPACEADGISPEKFGDFRFVALCEGFEVELTCSEDLEAALIYTGNKLQIAIQRSD